MSYRDWRQEHDVRLSPTERVILVLMLIGVTVLIAFRVFDSIPRPDTGVTVTQLLTSSGQTAEDGPVDLNSAGRAALLTLPGIGESKADAILAYREENGPFGSVDDLLNVRGIGQALLEQLRDKVYVSGASSSPD